MLKLTQIVIFTLLLSTAVISETPNTIKNHHLRQSQNNHHQHHHHNHHQHQLNKPLPHQRQHRKLSNNEPLTKASQSLHPDSEVELLDKLPSLPTTAKNATTHLRRLTARDYYNNIVQRRLHRNGITNRNVNGHHDWGYNTYNVLTNTYGPPQPSYYDTNRYPNNGKGDDNTEDVEFVENSASNSNPEWSVGPMNPRRSFDYSTQAPHPTRRAILVSQHTTTLQPPPLVPARRGYVAPSVETNNKGHGTTESPIETNTISNKNAPHDMERRHICVQQRTITTPVKTTEVYSRPIWKHINIPCQPQTQSNQMCTRVQLVHEPAYRDVVRHKSSQQTTYDCCTGWMKESLQADGCMKPICSMRCQNGGSCTGPDTCSCASGFTGRYCEHGINECKEEKPCDQTCVNTVGSYYCRCREGFILQADQQSCRKIDLHKDDAFEARDLENEIEANEDLTDRLHKIERSLANERVHTNELQKSLQSTYSVVDTLKSRLSTLEKQQLDVNRLQTNLYATESRTNKLEGMVNLLMMCRNGPNAKCP